MIEIPYGSIVTAVAAVFAVVIANRLSYRRSYLEKVWDLRRIAYGTILAELAAVERRCSEADEYISENTHRYFDEIRPEVEADIHKRMMIVRERLAQDYLIVSTEFRALFDEMDKKSTSAEGDFDWEEDYNAFSGAIRLYRPQLLSIARSEIELAGSVFRLPKRT